MASAVDASRSRGRFCGEFRAARRTPSTSGGTPHATTRTFSPIPVLALSRMKWFAQRKTLKLAAIFAVFLAAGSAYVLLQPDELARYKARLAAHGEELSL